MFAHSNKNEHRHDDMNNVEHLVLAFAEEQRRPKDDQHCRHCENGRPLNVRGEVEKLMLLRPGNYEDTRF